MTIVKKTMSSKLSCKKFTSIFMLTALDQNEDKNAFFMFTYWPCADCVQVLVPTQGCIHKNTQCA